MPGGFPRPGLCGVEPEGRGKGSGCISWAKGASAIAIANQALGDDDESGPSRC